MKFSQHLSRRSFLGTSVGALAGAGFLAGSVPPIAEADERPVATEGRRGRNRVGAVAYSYQYSIALFSYNNRPNEKFDALKFVEANHKAGGEVAQLYYTMIQDLDEDEIKRLRHRAEELDVLLEVHGGVALGKWSKFEETMHQAATLGSKVVGCSFGFLMRPDRINTLDAWDDHTSQCEARLRELAPLAKSLGLTIAVENHLDFSVEELRDLITRVNSPNVRVLFDVGNVLGTLGDPTEAADMLGPLTVATHNWLEDRFWTAYRNKTARQLAATLRHVRGKAINIDEYKLIEEIDKLPHEEHVKYEQDRLTRCIAYLKRTLEDINTQASA